MDTKMADNPSVSAMDTTTPSKSTKRKSTPAEDAEAKAAKKAKIRKYFQIPPMLKTALQTMTQFQIMTALVKYAEKHPAIDDEIKPYLPKLTPKQFSNFKNSLIEQATQVSGNRNWIQLLALCVEGVAMAELLSDTSLEHKQTRKELYAHMDRYFKRAIKRNTWSLDDLDKLKVELFEVTKKSNGELVFNDFIDAKKKRLEAGEKEDEETDSDDDMVIDMPVEASAPSDKEASKPAAEGAEEKAGKEPSETQTPKKEKTEQAKEEAGEKSEKKQRNRKSKSKEEVVESEQPEGEKEKEKEKEEETEIPVGTEFYKKFAGYGLFKGTVKKFAKPYYKVEYEDGDKEDLSKTELLNLLKKGKPKSKKDGQKKNKEETSTEKEDTQTGIPDPVVESTTTAEAKNDNKDDTATAAATSSSSSSEGAMAAGTEGQSDEKETEEKESKDEDSSDKGGKRETRKRGAKKE